MLRKTQVEQNWEIFGGHSPIATFFNSVHPINKEAIAELDKGTWPVAIKKGKFLIKAGGSGEFLYFVLKGVIRAYIVEEGKEITTWINEENELVGSIRNLGLEVPSEEHVQAIEHSELIAIPYALIQHMYDTYPESNIIGRKILEESYRDAEERAYISRIPSAEKKYKRFIETRSGLANRVPLKYIASYLGMTLETLSRIRNRRSI